MNEKAKEKAKHRAAQEAVDLSIGGTCDDAQCVVHIIKAAQHGFEAGYAATTVPADEELAKAVETCKKAIGWEPQLDAALRTLIAAVSAGDEERQEKSG